METKIFKIIVYALAFTGIFFGIYGGLLGLQGFYMLESIKAPEVIEPSLDNLYRFLIVQFLGIGLIMIWALNNISERAIPLRIALLSLFFGGLARLVSIIQIGVPNTITIISLVVELLVPLLILWHLRILRKESVVKRRN